MRARTALVVATGVLTLLALTGIAQGSLRTISVKEVVPGVPGWAVAAAVAFGAVVGGGFMAAQSAVRSRAAARGLEAGPLSSDSVVHRSAAVGRALSAETTAFVAEEGAYKSALLRRLGAGTLPEPDPARARARYAPCQHCTMPLRYPPDEEETRCLRCGRTSMLPLPDEDEE